MLNLVLGFLPTTAKAQFNYDTKQFRTVFSQICLTKDYRADVFLNHQYESLMDGSLYNVHCVFFFFFVCWIVCFLSDITVDKKKNLEISWLIELATLSPLGHELSCTNLPTLTTIRQREQRRQAGKTKATLPKRIWHLFRHHRNYLRAHLLPRWTWAAATPPPNLSGPLWSKPPPCFMTLQPLFIRLRAAGYGAQLVVFPEAFVGGNPRGSNFGTIIGNRSAKGREEFRKYHAAAIDVPGPEVDRLAAMAAKYKVYLVMGVIERDGYTLYCAVLFFNPQGHYLGKHRKIMPTALERIVWGFGDGSTIPVFETLIGKIGAAICWENRMPLLRTAMYGKGVEIYCAPTADARDTWQASMTHIALEGGCFVLSANQFCRRKDYPPPPDYIFTGLEEELTPDSVVCAGGSVIISPLGNVLAGPNYDGEALISADLDLGEIARAKFDFDVVGHYSRPEVLSLTVKDHPTNAVIFTSAAEKPESNHK